jgi:hypothetical protein
MSVTSSVPCTRSLCQTADAQVAGLLGPVIEAERQRASFAHHGQPHDHPIAAWNHPVTVAFEDPVYAAREGECREYVITGPAQVWWTDFAPPFTTGHMTAAVVLAMDYDDIAQRISLFSCAWHCHSDPSLCGSGLSGPVAG